MPDSSPHLQVRRRRALLIRKRVVAASVALFIAAFATIYVQLASGNDPALSAHASQSALTAHVTTSASNRAAVLEARRARAAARKAAAAKRATARKAATEKATAAAVTTSQS